LPLALALAVWLAPASAQEISHVAPAAKRSVGAVVLLANAAAHTADADLRAALTDADPRVRAVAARTIGVVPHGELYRDLVGALAREQDGVAAAELTRAVLYLGRGADMPLVLIVAKRLGPAVAPVVAEWTGRVQPEQLLKLLPELTTLAGARAGRLSGIVAMAAVTHADQQDALVRAWMAEAPRGQWNVVLRSLYRDGDDLKRAAPLFKDALQSSRQTVREETLWYLIALLATRRDVPKDVLEAGLPREETDQTEWETFGRNLIARRLKKAPAADRSELIKNATGRDRFYTFGLRDLPQLTAAERAATPDSSRPAWEVFADWNGSPSVRTMPAIAPGVIAETLSSAGCTIDTPRTVAALVAFTPDGRPRTITRDPRAQPASCLDAFTALTRLAVADADYVVGEAAQTVVLPLLQAFVACSSDADADTSSAGAVRVGEIIAPRKTHDVPPIYPAEAQSKGIQGVIIIDAIISRTGCVSDARVTRSIPYLDIPALTAVMQWTFEPTRIGDQAVPTIMTVTVNFQLR